MRGRGEYKKNKGYVNERKMRTPLGYSRFLAITSGSTPTIMGTPVFILIIICIYAYSKLQLFTKYSCSLNRRVINFNGFSHSTESTTSTTSKPVINSNFSRNHEQCLQQSRNKSLGASIQYRKTVCEGERERERDRDELKVMVVRTISPSSYICINKKITIFNNTKQERKKLS